MDPKGEPVKFPVNCNVYTGRGDTSTELLIFASKNQRLKENDDDDDARVAQEGKRDRETPRSRGDGDCASEVSRKHALRLLPGLTLSRELSIRIN